MTRRSDYTRNQTWFEVAGKSKSQAPILLLHGVGLDLTMWDAQVETLEASWQVVRYDFWGHGRTPPKTGIKGIQDYVEQLQELLEHLGIEKLHLIGLSMGGLIAQGFAKAATERLLSLTLMNTVYRRREEELEGVRSRLKLTKTHGLEPITQAALKRWFDDDFKSQHPEIIEYLTTRLTTNDLTSYIAAYSVFIEADNEIGEVLKNVYCPTLVMTGEKDVGSTPEIAQRMVDDLPNSRIEIIPRLHHLAPLENPEVVNKILIDFLHSV